MGLISHRPPPVDDDESAFIDHDYDSRPHQPSRDPVSKLEPWRTHGSRSSLRNTDGAATGPRRATEQKVL